MAATYATIANLRGVVGVLDQATATDVNRDVIMQACLDDAQAILDGEMGFTLVAAAATTKVVYGDGTAYLTPPPHTAGSVTLVVGPTGYTVPAYVQQNGILVTTDASGLLYLPPGYSFAWSAYAWSAYNPFASSAGVWARGVPYTVSATYGAAAADLLVVRRITLELAVQLYRFRDAGGSTVISTEAAIVTVKNAFSPVVRGAIERLKQKYAPSVGVW